MLDLGYLNKLIKTKQNKDKNSLITFVKDQFPIFEEAVEVAANNGYNCGSFKLWLPSEIKQPNNNIIVLAFNTLKLAYSPIEIRFSCGITTYETDLNTNRNYLDLWFVVPKDKQKSDSYGDRVVWEVE
jgi:hypothetical protein